MKCDGVYVHKKREGERKGVGNGAKEGGGRERKRERERERERGRENLVFSVVAINLLSIHR